VIPTLADVQAARERIAPHLPQTPLYPNDALTELVGAEMFVKHENHLPIGAFKVRGGVNLVAQLNEDERRSGVVTASTGNHGQSIAFRGRPLQRAGDRLRARRRKSGEARGNGALGRGARRPRARLR
jgi:threonine dehydratase